MARAGDRRFVRVNVQEHNGNVREGELTLRIDADWQTIIPDLPVSYQELSGGETIRGRQMEADATALLTVPWSPATRAITPKMRLVTSDGRVLQIKSALDLKGDNREITIQAGVPQ